MDGILLGKLKKFRRTSSLGLAVWLPPSLALALPAPDGAGPFGSQRVTSSGPLLILWGQVWLELESPKLRW